MVSKEIKKLDKFCVGIKDNVDVLIGAKWTLVDDICAFNKYYAADLKLKKEFDGNAFTSIEKSPTGFHDRLLKVDFSSTTLIS